MTRIPLDALIRRVSRIAEQRFNREGEIDPIWLVETVSGEQQIIVSPVMAPSALATSDYKDKLAAKMAKPSRTSMSFATRAQRNAGPSMRR